MIRHTYSLILVWRLAELEAANLKSDQIEPAHFFLGLLKVVDLDLQAVCGKSPQFQLMDGTEIKQDVARLRECFNQFDIDTTAIRRKCRKLLGVGVGGTANSDEKLRRSVESREVFSRAERVAQSGDGQVRPLHILLALLQIADANIDTILDEAGCDPNDLKREVSEVLLKTSVAVAGVQEDLNAPLKSAPKDEVLDAPRPPKRRRTLLDAIGRDLTELARDGKLEPIFGRQDEMRKIAQVLVQSRKNNVILIGEAGVGKTGIVEGLAMRIVEGGVLSDFENKRIIEVSMAALVAGTTLRGEFEARLQRLVKEASEDSNVIIFIDEIHLMMGAGQGSGAMDAANILKPALSRGEIRVIGATTTAEYRRFIEKDPAMERRFQLIKVEEPTREEALEIMRGLRPRMEKHHHAKISDDALETSVELSLRYLPDQRLPDKAIDLIDQACSQARLQSLSGDLHALFKEGIPITGAEIITVISHRCGIPIGKLTEAEGTRLLEMESVLEERVKGQNKAIAAVSQAIRLSRSGLKNPNKPIGVFLFAGATGSGKTELAKALAGFLYGDERKLLRFDMSEFMDEHSVSKLIGSPPGFRDHEQGGQLTEKIRSHPYSVVLFDEIEKGHPKIMDIFLQMFDEGTLTDSRGRRCDFQESLIILTSNLGSGSAKAKLGFGRESEADDSKRAFTDSVITSIKKTLRPELINRLSEIVVFQPLGVEDIRRVISKFITALSQRLESRNITIRLESAAYDFLMQEGYNQEFGARPMERTIETLIAKPLADLLIRGDIQNGSCVIVTASTAGIALRVNQ